MKKIILAIATTAIVALSAQAGQKKTITFDQLPEVSQELINQYFNKDEITSVTQETEGKKMEYEVRFKDGSSIDFDNKGHWNDIESTVKPINPNIIPIAIINDIKTKYGKNAHVKKIKADSTGYEVDLNNGKELEYNSAFKIKKH